MPVRLISVTAAQLQEENQVQQLTFWEDTEGKKQQQLENLERTMDTIRGRYGKNIIRFGSTVGNELVEKKTEEENLPPET